MTLNTQRVIQIGLGTVILFVSARLIHAQYDLTWRTIDGGGRFSASSSFELKGTIGQCDAGYQSSASFELEGGFWTSASSDGCACIADLNGDGERNGRDVHQFVACMVSITPVDACECADVHVTPGLDFDDVSVFVATLISGDACN